MKNEYKLSIRFSSDGFSLSILDKTDVSLVKRDVFESLFQMQKNEIVQLFETQAGIVPSDYNEIQLIVESGFYVFVPSSIFKIQNTDDYFYFQHEKDKRQIVLFNRIPNWDAVNVFSIPAQLNEALNELFPDAVVNHQLSYFLSEKIRTRENGVYVWIRPKMFDVAVVKSGILTLTNSFAYHTAEDFAYFILSIFDQLKLDTETIAVTITNYELRNTKFGESVNRLIGKLVNLKFEI